MAYNQETKEKQAFEEAMKNADDFFAKGLLKMQSKTNIQENITEYKKLLEQPILIKDMLKQVNILKKYWNLMERIMKQYF